MAGYIADFYASDFKLVIEVDGDGHAVRETVDQHRAKTLEREGFRILRFGNTDVMHTLDGVLEAILMMARAIPLPSHSGEREQ